MANTIDLSGLVRPQLVEATKREDTPNVAEFRLQPLERGFGLAATAERFYPSRRAVVRQSYAGLYGRAVFIAADVDLLKPKAEALIVVTVAHFGGRDFAVSDI